MTPFMSRTQLDISQINEADIIRYYTLPDGTLGLIVIYEGKKYIDLCEYDDCFSMLSDTADRLYLKDPNVCADEYTQGMLESRRSFSHPDRFAFLTSCTRHSEMALTSGESEFPAELAEYFLSRIYADAEADLRVTETKGRRDNYCIMCRVNGEDKILPCSFSEKRTEYGFVIGNIFEATDKADITVRYSHARAEVITNCFAERNIRHEYCYDISESKLTHRIMEDDQVIFLDESSLTLDTAEMSAQLRLICGTEGGSFRGYVLPWGDKVFTDNAETIFDNGSGMIVQILDEKLFNNRSGEVSAVHKVLTRRDKALIRSKLSFEGLIKSVDSDQSGYYYRQLQGSDITDIKDDIFGITDAQLIHRYLYR